MIRIIALLLFAAATVAPTPVRWSAAPISSARYESHPAFDPAGRTLLFVRSAPDFSGWRLFVSECGPQGWGAPQPAPFAGDGVEADPFFTHDGEILYFISSRSEEGARQNDLDIWRVAFRGARNWGEPERLPDPVNSSGHEWFPRLAADGWLYFGSDRPGGFGRTDIYRAKADPAGVWRIENLGAAINTEGDEYEAEISRDGTRMVVMADGDLYESHAAKDWSMRVKLGPEINTSAMEVGPLLAPDNGALLFARDSGDATWSGEFYLHGSAAAWPPACNTGP